MHRGPLEKPQPEDVRAKSRCAHAVREQARLSEPARPLDDEDACAVRAEELLDLRELGHPTYERTTRRSVPQVHEEPRRGQRGRLLPRKVQVPPLGPTGPRLPRGRAGRHLRDRLPEAHRRPRETGRPRRDGGIEKRPFHALGLDAPRGRQPIGFEDAGEAGGPARCLSEEASGDERRDRAGDVAPVHAGRRCDARLRRSHRRVRARVSLRVGEPQEYLLPERRFDSGGGHAPGRTAGLIDPARVSGRNWRAHVLGLPLRSAGRRSRSRVTYAEYSYHLRLVPAVLLGWVAWVARRAPHQERANRLLALFLAILAAGQLMSFASAGLGGDGRSEAARLFRRLERPLGYLDPPLLLVYALSFPRIRPALRSVALWTGYAAAALGLLTVGPGSGANVGNTADALRVLDLAYVNGTYLLAFWVLLRAFAVEPGRYLARELAFVVVAVAFAGLSRSGAIFWLGPAAIRYEAGIPRIAPALALSLGTLGAILLLHRWTRHPGDRSVRRLGLGLAGLLVAFHVLWPPARS